VGWTSTTPTRITFLRGTFNPTHRRLIVTLDLDNLIKERETQINMLTGELRLLIAMKNGNYTVTGPDPAGPDPAPTQQPEPEGEELVDA
jgi:hypothetical protein